MSEYFNYYDDRDLIYIRRKGKGAEFKFEVEILPNVILTGKIDGIVQTRNKLRWMIEHKSFGKSMPNEDHRWRNIQSSAYLRVVEILGWSQLEGTCWDYVYSKTPHKPELLKNGTLSKRQLVTLPSRLLETIKEYGLDPKDYREMLVSVESNRDKYFQRIFNPTKKAVVDLQFKDLVESAREIADSNLKPVRTIDRHCEWCDYEALCRAELTASDVDYVKEKEYYLDEEEHQPDRTE